MAGPATELATKPVAIPLNKLLLVDVPKRLLSDFTISLMEKSFSKTPASGKCNVKKEKN
jgi:hypothetical protein